MNNVEFIVAVFIPFLVIFSTTGILYYKLWIIPERKRKKAS